MRMKVNIKLKFILAFFELGDEIDQSIYLWNNWTANLIKFSIKILPTKTSPEVS